MSAIEPLSVYADSDEIADALERLQLTATGEAAYWLPEAAAHIRGLYGLAADMQKELRRLEAA